MSGLTLNKAGNNAIHTTRYIEAVRLYTAVYIYFFFK